MTFANKKPLVRKIKTQDNKCEMKIKQYLCRIKD